MLLKHRRKWIANGKTVRIGVNFIAQQLNEEFNHFESQSVASSLHVNTSVMRDRPLRQLLLQSKGGTLYWKGGTKGRRLPLFVQDDRELVTNE